jgi:hypothetical protein
VHGTSATLEGEKRASSGLGPGEDPPVHFDGLPPLEIPHNPARQTALQGPIGKEGGKSGAPEELTLEDMGVVLVRHGPPIGVLLTRG